MDSEHMEAWLKLKKHLAEHERNLLKQQDMLVEAGPESDAIDVVIEDIDDSINKVEELFIC